MVIINARTRARNVHARARFFIVRQSRSYAVYRTARSTGSAGRLRGSVLALFKKRLYIIFNKNNTKNAFCHVKKLSKKTVNIEQSSIIN